MYNLLHNSSDNFYVCTLFPDSVLPVISSLLIDKVNSFGRFGMFHGCIGVSRCASCKKNGSPFETVKKMGWREYFKNYIILDGIDENNTRGLFSYFLFM